MNPKRYTKIDCLLIARRKQVRTLKRDNAIKDKRIAELIAEKEQQDEQLERHIKGAYKALFGEKV